jgi:hypothetical protein
VDGELLFSSGSLTDALQARSAEAEQEIDDWDPEALLNTPDSEIMDYLAGKYELTCPELHRDQLEQEPVSEELRTGMGQFSGRPVEQRLTKIVVVVPFDGETDVFRLQPSSFTLNPPRAGVDGQGELRLTWLGDPDAGRDAAAIRRYFDGLLDNIERYLRSACADIEGHNARLRTQISYRLAQRKHRLQADRQLATDLGFRIRRRPDAADYAVPVMRRTIITPRRPSPNSAGPAEPFLADAHYEEALAVLRSARNALERSPSLTATMSEETIRDLLLVFLNAHFEGAAAGEVFNAHGKTDILIRVNDRNVFIAECKIWAGPKKFSDAIDQLLGYLTWRDTKAALILFIRTGQPTDVIAKAISEIEGHPNYKRTVLGGEDSERYDFVLRPTSDPEQEIRLALLPFALQDS